MPKSNQQVNLDLEDLLASKGYDVTSLDSSGKQLPTAGLADVQTFHFHRDGKDYGTVTVSIDGLKNMIVYYDDEIANSGVNEDDMDGDRGMNGTSWISLVKQLKKFAQRHQLGFVLKDTDRLRTDMKRRSQNERELKEGAQLKRVKREYNQAAKNKGGDFDGSGKKIDNMKKSIRQKDIGKDKTVAEGSLNEFAPGDGGDGGDDRTYEYEVYQCNPNDEFDWIGGAIYKTNSMDKAHGIAYKLHEKHPDKAFMIWQERSQGSRGGYGIKDDDQDVNEDWKEKVGAGLTAAAMAAGANGVVLNPARPIGPKGQTVANPYKATNTKSTEDDAWSKIEKRKAAEKKGVAEGLSDIVKGVKRKVAGKADPKEVEHMYGRIARSAIKHKTPDQAEKDIKRWEKVNKVVNKEGVAEGYVQYGEPSNTQEFKVTYYDPKYDQTRTSTIKARDKTAALDYCDGKGYDVQSIEPKGVAEGSSKRDQKDIEAIKAAIARLESQLKHPNADKSDIQQSIAHEKKRLALYGKDLAEGSLNESDKFTSWYDWKDQAKSSGYTIAKKNDKLVALNKQGQVVGHWSDLGKFLSGKAPRPNFNASTRSNMKLDEGYYGNKKMSYNDDTPQVKMIIKHNRQLEETDQRFRHIEKIFLETSDGERFGVPTNKPSRARMFARHIAEGGGYKDERWNHIAEISEDIDSLGGFIRATRSGDQFNESAQRMISEAADKYRELRETAKRLCSDRGYNSYFESYEPPMENDNDDDLLEVFKHSSVDSRIEKALPTLNKLGIRRGKLEEADMFEQWADSLIDESLDIDGDRQAEAIIELFADELPVGPNAEVAIGELADVIEDDDLYARLRRTAAVNPNSDARPQIIAWMQEQEGSDYRGLLAKLEAEDDDSAEDQEELKKSDQSDSLEPEKVKPKKKKPAPDAAGGMGGMPPLPPLPGGDMGGAGGLPPLPPLKEGDDTLAGIKRLLGL